MSKTNIKIIESGLVKLMQSPEMKKEVEKVAQEKWGHHTHHHIRSFVGFDRAKAILYLNTNRYPS